MSGLVPVADTVVEARYSSKLGVLVFVAAIEERAVLVVSRLVLVALHLLDDVFCSSFCLGYSSYSDLDELKFWLTLGGK